MKPLFKLTKQEANTPRPKPPDNINPRSWMYYYNDLACWIATKAEAMLSGIED